MAGGGRIQRRRSKGYAGRPDSGWPAAFMTPHIAEGGGDSFSAGISGRHHPPPTAGPNSVVLLP